MITNDHEKNIRHYPLINRNSVLNNHPIPMPPSKESAKIDEEWEVLEVSKPSMPAYNIIGAPDDIDENDFGGLINRNFNPFTDHRQIIDELKLRTEMDRTSIDTATSDDGPTTDDDNPAPEYYHYLLKKDAVKYEWIINDVLAIGGHPIYTADKDHLDFLREAGFKAIVSAFDIPLLNDYLTGFDYYFAPTLEGYTSDLIGICDFIKKMEESKKPIFVHSLNSRGRCGTIIAAYFIYRGWLTTPEAITYMRNIKEDLIETEYQETALYKFAARLK